jgi:hypothetical protein
MEDKDPEVEVSTLHKKVEEEVAIIINLQLEPC